MKNLVFAIIGSGGREFALYRKVSVSPLVKKVFVIPGNAGIPNQHRLRADLNDHRAVAALLRREGVTDVLIGPEQYLVAGLADSLRTYDFRVFGPDAEQARLEGSKIHSKKVMVQCRIRTAKYRVAVNMEQAERGIAHFAAGVVVKADGLAAGKGVRMPKSVEEAIQDACDMIVRRVFKEAGSKILLEQRLRGNERSSHWLCDGVQGFPMLITQDHKRAFDGDEGPNTGGMGVFGPVPNVGEDYYQRVEAEVVKRLLKAIPFQGVLYIGLMETPEGLLFVLEFNVRFGDPETQVLMALLESDPVPYFVAGAEFGGFAKAGLGSLKFSNQKAVYRVYAANGYPDSPVLGSPVRDNGHDTDQAYVCYSGVEWDADGSRMLASGGRAFGIIGMGKTFKEARERIDARRRDINAPGTFSRSDIALNLA